MKRRKTPAAAQKFEDSGQKLHELVARDVTERRNWESVLRESEEMFRCLADNSPNMIFINQAGRLTYVNKKCEQIIGISRKEFCSPRFHFGSLIAPEFKEQIQDLFRKHATGQEVPPYEYEILTKQGKRLTVINSTKLIQYKGKPAILGVVTDITGRKRAEKTLLDLNEKLARSEQQLRKANQKLFKQHSALRENLELYRALVETSPDAILLVDTKSRFQMVNRQGAQLFGFRKSADLIGKDALRFIAEKDQATARKDAQALAEAGGISRTAYTFLRKDGSSLEGEMSATMVRDATGRPVGFLCVVRNVTDRRKAEEALRESEERYRSFVERANDGIALIQDGVMRFANKKLLEMHGVLLEDYIGKPFLSYVFPDERERVRALYGARMTGGRIPTIYESTILRADGSRMDVEFNAGLVTYGGRIANLVFVRDITERKRAEKALRDSELLNRTTIDSMRDAIHVVDKDFRIILHNQVIADMNQNFGYAGQLIGKTILEAFPFLDPAVLDLYKKVFAAGQPVRTEDETRFSQRSIHTETDRIPVIEDGNVSRVLTVIRDVTGHKMAEQEIRQAKDTAEEASRAKSDFLTAMSHELRTPLTSILGFAELFQQRKIGNLSDRDLVFMEKIMRNGQHLLTLINGLLDLAKIESGRMSIQIESVNVKEIIEEVAAAAMPLTKDKPIHMKVSVKNPALTMTTDPLRLRQVLFNLVGNAVKFTQKGRVEIHARQSRAEGKPIFIHVLDTGMGIPAGRLAGIFDRFNQLQGNAAKSQGTGIGLAISKSIIELLGGRIEARSKQNKGSIFTIRLPAQADARLLAKNE